MLQTSADRIRVWPVRAGHILVNDHDLRRLFRILFGEVAPADELNLHRLKIAHAGDTLVGLDHTLPGRRVITFNRDAAPTDTSGERQRRNAARRLNAGQPPEALP